MPVKLDKNRKSGLLCNHCRERTRVTRTSRICGVLVRERSCQRCGMKFETEERVRDKIAK